MQLKKNENEQRRNNITRVSVQYKSYLSLPRGSYVSSGEWDNISPSSSVSFIRLWPVGMSTDLLCQMHANLTHRRQT